MYRDIHSTSPVTLEKPDSYRWQTQLWISYDIEQKEPSDRMWIRRYPSQEERFPLTTLHESLWHGSLVRFVWLFETGSLQKCTTQPRFYFDGSHAVFVSWVPGLQMRATPHWMMALRPLASVVGTTAAPLPLPQKPKNIIVKLLLLCKNGQGRSYIGEL